jgi:hypothetical protein
MIRMTPNPLSRVVVVVVRRGGVGAATVAKLVVAISKCRLLQVRELVKKY